MEYLDMIENLLIENGVDIEDYNDPERGISKYEAVKNAIVQLIVDKDRLSFNNFISKDY